MKARFLAGFLIASIALIPAIASPQNSSKSDQKPSASDKDKIPFPNAPRIKAEDVAQLIKDGKVVIVDTDDPEAYAAEHIKGAINIAFDPTVDSRAQDQTLSALPGDRMVVFYCNCPHEEDSAPMVLEMQELGYDRDKVKALEGGLSRWEKLGYPLVGTDVNTSEAKGN